MRANDLLRYVIRPTLTYLVESGGSPALASPVAEVLLLATCAQESRMGEYLHQPNGPARGIYQMEPATIAWVLTEITDRYPALTQAIYDLAPSEKVRGSVEGALHYATALCRMRYWLAPEALPTETTAAALWPFYKRWWNSELGKATEVQFVRNYQRYVRI